MRLSLLAGVGIALALAVPSGAHAAPKPVEVQLLGINDFHGQLDPPGGSGGLIGGIPVGGAEYLSTHLREAEGENPHTVIVSAGDLIGASPLNSALFHDEPTIEAMNEMGLDLNAVGNHEFDEGVTELLRMQQGGCHPTDGCQDGTGFGGADFGFLAANVVWRDSGEPILPAYAIRKFRGIKVGFIGMTLEGTPDIVSQEGIADVRFLDEAETANRYARILRREHGVRAIVVLLHEGGVPVSGTPVDDCGGVSLPISDIVGRTTDQVDLFVTGHTHQAYSCVIDGRPVTSAASQGKVITDIDLTLDRRTRDVAQVRKDNVLVTRDVAKDPAITAIIDRYRPFVEQLAGRVVGRVSSSLTRTPDDSGETTMGNLIADSQLAATRDAGAVAAFMNPGGVRASLDPRTDGTVTYGQIFTVQPFGNSLVTMDLTGAQLYRMLAQQWCEQSFQRVLLPSQGVTYTWDRSIAAANLGDDHPGQDDCAIEPNPATDLRIGGTPVDPAAGYRVTVNSFLAGGGDLIRVLAEGTNRAGGELDLDALEAYLAPSLTGDPIAPPALDRITVVP